MLTKNSAKVYDFTMSDSNFFSIDATKETNFSFDYFFKTNKNLFPWFTETSFNFLKYQHFFYPFFSLLKQSNEKYFSLESYYLKFAKLFKTSQRKNSSSSQVSSFSLVKGSNYILRNLLEFFSLTKGPFLKKSYPLFTATQSNNLFIKHGKFLFTKLMDIVKLFNFEKYFFFEKNIFRNSLKIFATKIILRYYYNWINFSDYLLSKKLNKYTFSKRYSKKKQVKSKLFRKNFKIFPNVSTILKKSKLLNSKVFFINKFKRYKRTYLQRVLLKSAKLLKKIKKRIFVSSQNDIKIFQNFYFNLKKEDFDYAYKKIRKLPLSFINKLKKKYKIKKKFINYVSFNAAGRRGKNFLFYNTNKRNLFLKFKLRFFKTKLKFNVKRYMLTKDPQKYKKGLSLFKEHNKNFAKFSRLFLLCSLNKKKLKFAGSKKNFFNKTSSPNFKRTFFLRKNFCKLKNYYNFSAFFLRKKFLPLNFNHSNESLLKNSTSFFSKKKSRLKFLNFKFLKFKRIYTGFKIKKFALFQKEIRNNFKNRVFRNIKKFVKKNKKFFFNYNFTNKLGLNKYNPDIKATPLPFVNYIWKKFRFIKNTFLVKILLKKRNFFVNLTQEGSGRTLFSSSGGKGGFSGRTQLSKRSANLAGLRLMNFFRRKNLGVQNGLSEATPLKFVPKNKPITYDIKAMLRNQLFRKFTTRLKKHLNRKRINFAFDSKKIQVIEKAKFIRQRNKIKKEDSAATLLYRNFLFFNFIPPGVIKRQLMVTASIFKKKLFPVSLIFRRIKQKKDRHLLKLKQKDKKLKRKLRLRLKYQRKRHLAKRLLNVNFLKNTRHKSLFFLKNLRFKCKRFLFKSFYIRFRNKIFYGYRYFLRFWYFRKKKKLKRKFFRLKKIYALKKKIYKKNKKVFFFFTRRFKKRLRKRRFLLRKIRRRIFRSSIFNKIFKVVHNKDVWRRIKRYIRKNTFKPMARSTYYKVGKVFANLKRRSIYLTKKVRIGRVKFIYRGFKKSRALYVTRAVSYGLFLRKFLKMKPFYRRVVPFGFSRKSAVRRL
jgi:hypothetical protein